MTAPTIQQAVKVAAEQRGTKSRLEIHVTLEWGTRHATAKQTAMLIARAITRAALPRPQDRQRLWRGILRKIARAKAQQP